MGFFVLQIFLPALAFAQDSSSFNDDDGPNDHKPIPTFLIFIFVGLGGILLFGCWRICTYQNNDDDSIISTTLQQYRNDTEGLQSWVSILLRNYIVSSQRYNVIPISITLARGMFTNAEPLYMFTV